MVILVTNEWFCQFTKIRDADNLSHSCCAAAYPSQVFLVQASNSQMILILPIVFNSKQWCLQPDH